LFINFQSVVEFNNAPFGIAIGTPILLPLLTFYYGKKCDVKVPIVLIIMLITCIISKTIDWFIAPETHDSEGIALMTLLSILTSCIFFIVCVVQIIYKKLNVKKISVVILILITISMPYLHILFMKKYYNQNLNVTNKTLSEYFDR